MGTNPTFGAWFSDYCVAVRLLDYNGPIDRDSAQEDYENGVDADDAAESFVEEMNS